MELDVKSELLLPVVVLALLAVGVIAYQFMAHKKQLEPCGVGLHAKHFYCLANLSTAPGVHKDAEH
jgi:hypothetical protein